jgi:hypothetical protein
MTRQDALRHLLFGHQPDKASPRYGKNPLARSIVAWNVALKLCDDDENKVTELLLDDIINAINHGENVVEIFMNGDYEQALEKVEEDL